MNSSGSAPATTTQVSGTTNNPGVGGSVVTGSFTPPNNSSVLVALVFDAHNGLFSSSLNISVTDNQGNSYVLIGNSSFFDGSANGSQTLAFIAENVAANSTVLTFTQNFGPPATFVGLNYYVNTITNLTDAGNVIPSFQLLQPPQIPVLDASKIGTGQLALARGGTAANLSATGGAHKFLSQASSGAAITVVQPDFSDLSGATKISKYNNISTVSNGVPSEYATVDLTAQGAAITATTLYAVPAAGAGMYRISWVAAVTTAATTSSTLGGTNGFQIVYTDADDSVVKTTPAPGAPSAGVNQAYSQTNQGNTTATQISGVIIVRAKASTNIQYQMDYTSSGVTAMAFNVHIKLEAL